MHIVQTLVALNVGGSELVATELSEYLVRQGHRTTIIAADGPLGGRVRAGGAEILDWPIGKKRIRTLGYIKRLSEWIEQNRPDVLHAHSRIPAWICLKAITALSEEIRPAFVTTMHGHYSVSPYSAVMARGAKTIAVSDHIRRYVLQNYKSVNKEDVVVIHGGASSKAFPNAHQPPVGWRRTAEDEFPELANKRWLLLPGRVTRWKGHVEFISLLDSLIDDFPDLQGVFVGGAKSGSSYRRSLEKRAKEAGLEEKITFTGDRLDIRDWMAEAEIVFNLSNRPPEAFGRTVLESLRLGCPLIAWNHGGAAEILSEMFPEGAVEPNDFQQLESLTRQFLTTRPMVPASDAFDLELSMSKHLALYREITSDRNQLSVDQEQVAN